MLAELVYNRVRESRLGVDRPLEPSRVIHPAERVRQQLSIGTFASGTSLESG
jgi:hypothetical protein